MINFFEMQQSSKYIRWKDGTENISNFLYYITMNIQKISRPV